MSTVNYLLQKESGKYERRLKFHSYNDSSFNFQFGVFFCCAVEEKKFHPPAKKKKKKKGNKQDEALFQPWNRGGASRKWAPL